MSLPVVSLRGPFPIRPKNANTAEPRDHRDSFRLLDLPSELVLVIASCLDRGSLILLSLSCRRLRDLLLDSHLDMTLNDDDKATKARFLQLYELDHPEYLTCRPCAILFPWQKTKSSQYRCPRADFHKRSKPRLGAEKFLPAEGSVCVRRTVIDLILRAHEYGPSYGLPLSYFKVSRYGSHGAFRTYKARVVDGQLILAGQMHFEIRSGEVLQNMFSNVYLNGCYHMVPILKTDDKWQTFKLAVSNMEDVGSEISEVFKCPFCETDHHVHARKDTADVTKVVMSTWRNYGRRNGNKPWVEQIFHRDPAPTDADIISQRDVRAEFESNGGPFGAEASS